MKVSELAKNIGVPESKIFEYLASIQIQVPHDTDHLLSEELASNVIKNKFEFDKRQKNRVDVAQVISEIDESELARMIAAPSAEILGRIKEENQLDNLILSGSLKKDNTRDFGYLEDVLALNGQPVYYPAYGSYPKTKILRVFVNNPDRLNEGERYHFKVDLANTKERLKRRNPYLLQTSKNKIEQAAQIDEISLAIVQKQAELNSIKVKLDDVDEEVRQKVDEANNTIEQYNIKIQETYNSLTEKQHSINELNNQLEAQKNDLKTMENLVSTLKERVALCRNLQFINEQDEKKYLQILSEKDFNPEGYLSFESDFENDNTKLADHIHAYLYHKKNLIYTSHQIRNFLSLLKTHDLIVLSGLSGSGKTQIVKAFAEAMGGVAKIIPVKPNWTSAEDLIGYYNPIQMSFLPTPFTEAIIEAIHNPQQLYFVCLDEMNLARVEYYFADFLSKLEERHKEPEIELYANHEEELFISEFNTLLNLIEKSIAGKQISSWQDFLDDKEARNHFFDMLGNIDKESMLQLHSRMKRRLVDILKFPSVIKIPNNVRFIGAINVDETTHYFSPKILDRVHIVKFDNPLLFEDEVRVWFESKTTPEDLRPVYVKPIGLSERKEFPAVNNEKYVAVTTQLKEINKKFLLPLNIDFGIRSIRQSLNYAVNNDGFFSDFEKNLVVSFNSIICQKILPRFVFDGSEISKDGKSKLEVAEELCSYLSEKLGQNYSNLEITEMEAGKLCSNYLSSMLEQAKKSNNNQVNFFS